MSVLLPMTTGMAVLGVVAASDLAASQTRPEMHPGVASSNALFADSRLGLRHFLELLEMFTGRVFSDRDIKRRYQF